MPKRHFCVNAVIFDMDGVITNTMPDHFYSWKKTLKAEGIHVGRHDIYRREGQQGMQTLREMFTEHNKKFDIKTAKRILRQKEDLFKRIVKTRFVPGAKGFLDSLHKSGIRLALVTGTSRHEMCRILPGKLRSFFDVIVTGTDVRRGKPHPEPYRKALKGLVLKASRAVVLENAPFGIASAKKAGLRCIAVETSLPKQYLDRADYVFKSLSDCRRHIKFTKDT